MLTERERSKAQAILHEYKDYPDEVDGDDVSWAVSVFAELIYHHFDKFPDNNAWIPTNERVPENTGCYVVTTKSTWNSFEAPKYDVFEAQYWAKEQKWCDVVDDTEIQDVVAWMSLPKPYKESEE